MVIQLNGFIEPEKVTEDMLVALTPSPRVHNFYVSNFGQASNDWVHGMIELNPYDKTSKLD